MYRRYISKYINNEINNCIRNKEYKSVFLYSLFEGTSLNEVMYIIQKYKINEKKLNKILYRNISINNHFCLKLMDKVEDFNFRV